MTTAHAIATAVASIVGSLANVASAHASGASVGRLLLRLDDLQKEVNARVAAIRSAITNGDSAAKKVGP